MKNTTKIQLSLILLFGAAHLVVAEQSSTNRLSVSVRYGFNITADFGHAIGGSGGAPRTTPNGDAYNYDDGYVLTDISGNAGGQTWNWGYDDSSAQVVGNEILMSRTSSSGAAGTSEMDESEPMLGLELVYSREFEAEGKYRFGFSFAASVMPLEFEGDSRYATSTSTTTDAYGFSIGTTPPTATPGSPYQGTFSGPGFLIDASPASSTTIVGPVGIVDVHSELDGILWGARIGPYMDFPVSTNLVVNLSGGLALGYLDVDVDWQATGAATERGGGSDSDMLSGAYLGAGLLWRVAEDWRVAAGLQFEYLNDWQGDFGAGTVELDFTRSLYATIGVQREF